MAGLLARPRRTAGSSSTCGTGPPVGNFTANVGLQIDQLSLTFVLLITGVGSLIHIYSIGYMKDDPKRRLFFAYLNLFVAAMLLLVLADNYLPLYVGWEGVAWPRTRWIGFWQRTSRVRPWRRRRPSWSTGWVTRAVRGDHGDLRVLRTVTFPEVFAQAGSPARDADLDRVVVAARRVWKVRAVPAAVVVAGRRRVRPRFPLIHAATMVTAGVALIARSNPIFDGAPTAQTVVIAIGAITLIFGAIIGLAKDEIRRCSGLTMSQIGIFTWCWPPASGRSATCSPSSTWSTTAFQAGMFLGAGSVMHLFNNQENMRRFGASAPSWWSRTSRSAGWLAIMGYRRSPASTRRRTRSSKPRSTTVGAWVWPP